jgi:hypothetical protein
VAAAAWLGLVDFAGELPRDLRSWSGGAAGACSLKVEQALRASANRSTARRTGW